MERKIFIVIPVFNKIQYTVKCLKSLTEQTYKNYQIIVVDDGSKDGTTHIINTQFPEATVLQGDGNLWWTGGTNMGVEYALKHAVDNDFILTLNNDLEVKPDYLEQLVKVSDHNKPCLVGSVAVDNRDPEKIEFLGERRNFYTGKSDHAVPLRPYSELVKDYDCIVSHVLPGRGTLIPSEVFRKIGIYDFEHFPHYAADHDFARRAYKAGYKLVVATKAVVISAVENTGLTYVLNPTFKVFFSSFFTIKSPVNLKLIYYWSIRHSPLKIGYMFVSLGRICFSFIRAFTLHRLRSVTTH
uniref:Glycosyltransferase family 2 protein n=1 Tax=Roseihalotalea indica TaxID=2867963 RepID=A0AA49JEU1_9BACT|nr:glycosyltransferase family 2 protein [Tunicatimonas sp. TK19036]